MVLIYFINNHMRRITLQERERLEEMVGAKMPIRECGRRLGRTHTALLYELKKRSVNGVYDAQSAHRHFLCEKEKKHERVSLLYTSRFRRNYIGERIEQGWSHEQIVGRAKLEGKQIGCVATAYKTVNSIKPQKRKRKKSGEKVSDGFDWNSDRKEQKAKDAGVFEVDTIQFEHSTLGIMSVIDIGTKYVHLAVVRMDKPIDMYFALGRYLMTMGGFVKKIIIDNGDENRHLDLLAQHGIEVQRCERGAPWEKPHVEYLNKELREYFPWDTDESDITHRNVDNLCYMLNHKPKKILGFASSFEVLQKHISITY